MSLEDFARINRRCGLNKSRSALCIARWQALRRRALCMHLRRPQRAAYVLRSSLQPRSTNEGQPMPRELLEGIYSSIARDELKISSGGWCLWVACGWLTMLGAAAVAAALFLPPLPPRSTDLLPVRLHSPSKLLSLACLTRRERRGRAALGVLVPAGPGRAAAARQDAAGRLQ